MKSQKKLLILVNVADLLDLGPNLTERVVLEAGLLDFEVGLVLIIPGELRLGSRLLTILDALNGTGNFHGIEIIKMENNPEESVESCLIGALLKLEAQEKDISFDNEFPRYFDCPHHHYYQQENREDVTEIVIGEQGNVFMRCDCIRKRNLLGMIANDSLSKMVRKRKILQKELLGKFLGGNPEGKFSCRSCLRVLSVN